MCAKGQHKLDLDCNHEPHRRNHSVPLDNLAGYRTYATHDRRSVICNTRMAVKAGFLAFLADFGTSQLVIGCTFQGSLGNGAPVLRAHWVPHAH